MVKLFFLLFLLNIFQPDNNINPVEVHFRNGEVNLYEEAGRSSLNSEKLTHNIKVVWNKGFFWLPFNNCSLIEFKTCHQKSITVGVTLSDGTEKEFEVFHDDICFRKEGSMVTFPLAKIQRISFTK